MQKIPAPSRRRLVLLERVLASVKTERITSAAISSITGWKDSCIRKDISLIGYKGGVSNGYKAADLRIAICRALGLSSGSGGIEKSGETQECVSVHNCCIVCLGRLGAALLENSIFFETPFRIVAGFDSNVNRTEILSASFPLHPARELEMVIRESEIEYAILAVNDSDAQGMAERLVACGIKGIVNYTGEVLSVPQNVAVENVSPVMALNNISARLMAE